MRYASIGCTVLALAASAHAQQRIGGVAIEASTGRPLPCIGVMLGGSDSVRRTYTADDGGFSFVVSPRDSATLTFSAWGTRAVQIPLLGLVKGEDNTREYFVDLVVASGSALRDSSTHLKAYIRDTSAPPTLVDPTQKPVYPRTLLNAGSMGDVIARYVVDSTGRVRSQAITVLGSSHPDFTRAVLEFLVAARFRPAHDMRVPRCASMTQHYSFSIRDP